MLFAYAASYLGGAIYTIFPICRREDLQTPSVQRAGMQRIRKEKAMDLKTKLASEEPSLLLRATSTEYNGVDLALAEANKAMLEIMIRKGFYRYQEYALEELLGSPSIVEEWRGFILHAWHLPDEKAFGSWVGSSEASKLLQYIPLMDEWKMVTLTCSQEDPAILISFHAVEHFTEQSILRQLMSLQLTREITNQILEAGYWTIDSHKNVVYLSGGMAAMLGRENNAHVIPVAEMRQQLHPGDGDTILETLDNISEKMAAFHGRCRKPDGETVHLYSYALPIFDRQGRLARIFGVSRNVTDAARSRNELAASRAQLDAVLESFDGILVACDLEGRYTYVGKEVARITGLSAKEITGQPMGYLIADYEDREAVLTELVRLFDHREHGRIKCRIKTADGGSRWFYFNLFPVEDVDGEVSEFAGIGQDINDTVLREELLRYMNSHDILTKLYNRRSFWKKIRELAQQPEKGYCIILMDINGLRMVNDVFGQDKGDTLLAQVADEIQTIFSQRAFISRMGGDEFAVILYHNNIAVVEEQCTQINTFCRKTTRKLLPVSISWGAACRNEAGSSQALFKLAESRMYNNKMIQGRSMSNEVVSSLKQALKTRTAETAAHMNRMEYMVRRLGNHLSLQYHDLDRLVLLASLHDVGKLGIPDHILHKPGSLTPDERDIIMTHCALGARIAMASHGLSDIAQEILCHHERWDGTGYPNGKSGEEIPFLSQVIAVVDTYDVITHKRCYKEAATHQEAVRELWRCAGSQFSPKVVRLFLTLFGSLTLEDIQQLSLE